MLDQIPDYEELAREYEEIVHSKDGWERICMLNYYYPPQTKFTGIIGQGSTGIKIKQTLSNCVSDKVSPKLIEIFKKASELFFQRLFAICKTPKPDNYNNLPDKELLDKYTNKFALVIGEEDKKKLPGCHAVIARLLNKNNFYGKVDFVNYSTFTGVYGEKEDILKFKSILHAQQHVNPSIITLQIARAITD